MENLVLIISIIGVNVALIYWVRSDMQAFVQRMETRTDAKRDEIHKQTLDFHGRLCSLEERFRDK